MQAIECLKSRFETLAQRQIVVNNMITKCQIRNQLTSLRRQCIKIDLAKIVAKLDVSTLKDNILWFHIKVFDVYLRQSLDSDANLTVWGCRKISHIQESLKFITNLLRQEIPNPVVSDLRLEMINSSRRLNAIMDMDRLHYLLSHSPQIRDLIWNCQPYYQCHFYYQDDTFVIIECISKIPTLILKQVKDIDALIEKYESLENFFARLLESHGQTINIPETKVEMSQHEIVIIDDYF